MAGNADEDCRHGKEKQKDEYGRGGKQKDVASTSGGWRKRVGRYSVKTESYSDGNKKVRKQSGRFVEYESDSDENGDPSGTPTSSVENTASEVGGISLGRSSKLANLSGTPTGSSETTAKSSENSRDMAGYADEDRRHGKEKQKDEDGRDGNQKDVASTSGGGRKQVGRYSVKTESCSDEDRRHGKEKQKDEDGRDGNQKDVASTSGGGRKQVGRYSVKTDSYSDGNGVDSLNLRAMFKGLIPFNWPEVRDRILRMPDPIRSGTQDPCEYSTSGEAPPPSSSSDSDVDETKKND